MSSLTPTPSVNGDPATRSAPVGLDRAGSDAGRASSGAVARRIFDLLVAGAGMVVAAPLFVIIAVLVKLDSRGPVFFRQVRVGRGRRPFEMWKFRKMPVDLPRQGPSLTLRDDPRLTRVGRFLERTKLDELPQLLNVLRGEMSVVGPRPEVPKFTLHHPERWTEVLSVKPGIFGPNQLVHRNESELYPPGIQDVEGHYVRHILPAKLERDARYAREANLLTDLGLLTLGLGASVFGTVTRRTIRAQGAALARLFALVGIGAATSVFAIALAGVAGDRREILDVLVLAALAKSVTLIAWRLPRTLAASLHGDDLASSAGCAFTAAALLFAALLAAGRPPDAKLVLVDGALFLGALLLARLLLHRASRLLSARRAEPLGWRMLCASLVLGPASAAACALVARGPGAGVEAPAVAATALAAAILCPAAQALARPVAARSGALAWLFAEGPLLLAVSWTGSSLVALAALAAGIPASGPHPPTAQTLVLCALMAGFGLWQNARVVPRGGRSGARTANVRSRWLLACHAHELGMCPDSLLGFASDHRSPDGIVTSDGRARGSHIGRVEVLGGFHDLPAILDATDATRIVVLSRGLAWSDLARLREVALRKGCRLYRCALRNDALDDPRHAARGART